jgi:hypothetical protein
MTRARDAGNSSQEAQTMRLSNSTLATGLLAIAFGMSDAIASQDPNPTAARDQTPQARASDVVSAETTIRETQSVSSAAAQEQANDSAGSAAASTGSDVGSGSTPTSAASVQAGTGNWWKDTDSDGDGRISAAEARANAGSGLHARFAAIDSDGDGYVKLEEYRTYFESNVGKTPR